MEPFLESGQLAGKIVCPNKKCGAKLGNYDWAGVCCSCKQWVTPVSLLVLYRWFLVASSHDPCVFFLLKGILHPSIQGR